MPNKLSCGNIIIHYIFTLVNKEKPLAEYIGLQ